MIGRAVINKAGINGTIIRDCEIDHLIKYNYVIANSGFVCVTDKLWSVLMNNEENQKIMQQFRESK